VALYFQQCKKLRRKFKTKLLPGGGIGVYLIFLICGEILEEVASKAPNLSKTRQLKR